MREIEEKQVKVSEMERIIIKEVIIFESKEKKNNLRSNGSESSRPRILTAWCNNKVREMWHRNPKKFCSIETCLSENKRNINASEKKIRTAIS